MRIKLEVITGRVNVLKSLNDKIRFRKSNKYSSKLVLIKCYIRNAEMKLNRPGNKDIKVAAC